MAKKQIGLWLIGAKGGVATTVMTGLAALARRLVEPIGLVTETEAFHSLNLTDWSDIVIGGHDIRDGSLLDEARRMWTVSRAIPPGVLDSVTPDLIDIEARLRPGTVVASGSSIQAIASLPESKAAKNSRDIINQIRTDIIDFAATNDVERVIVVNLASTEPPWSSPIPDDLDELFRLLEHQAESSPLPTSSLYAIAAFEADAAYINFTPSTGATPHALNTLAQQRGLPHAGCDGKTGETLLKSVLAPMFRDRHLEVMSWVGHNIFGNLDGKVLDDPSNKAAKVNSKDHLLANLLPSTPQTLVSIEFIESLGDWKTAWDHIHFQGFLGTPMTMQFTWQGCDSILAAPLVIDLVRLVDRARVAGEVGSLPWLASFFKSPLDCHEQGFAAQMTMLHDWIKKHSAQP